jgi:hypothetical protein
MRRSKLTAAMPSPVKLKSPIKNLEEASADNEVISKEVVGGGESILSITNRGNNEVEGKEMEWPRTRAFVGVVKTTGGEEMLEHGDDTGKHRVVTVAASRRGQGRSNNEVEGEEAEWPRTGAFFGVVAESPGGEERLEHSKDMGEHRVVAAAASRQGQGRGQGKGQG